MHCWSGGRKTSVCDEPVQLIPEQENLTFKADTLVVEMVVDVGIGFALQQLYLYEESRNISGRVISMTENIVLQFAQT